MVRSSTQVTLKRRAACLTANRPNQFPQHHGPNHHRLERRPTSGGITRVTIVDPFLASTATLRRNVRQQDLPYQYCRSIDELYRAGWNNVLGAVKQSQRIRATRKNLHREIGSNNSVARFNEIQIAEVGRFLLRVLDAPDKLMQHIRK